MTHWKLTMMVFAMLGVFAMGVHGQNSVGMLRKGRVSAHAVVIRARPGTHYESLGKFQEGDVVKIVGESEGWYRVEVPEDVTGWVPADGVDADGIVHKEVLIYAGPGIVFTALGKAQIGDHLKIRNKMVDNFWPVKAPLGLTAWVSKVYIQVQEGELAVPIDKPEVAVMRLATLEKEATGLRENQAKVTDTLKELRDESARLEKEAQTASKKAEQLRSEREQAEARAATELARLEKERDDAVRTASEMKNEKAQWQKAIDERNEEIKKAREELTKLKMEAAVSSKKLEDEKAELMKRAENAREQVAKAEENMKINEKRLAQLESSIKEMMMARSDAEPLEMMPGLFLICSIGH